MRFPIDAMSIEFVVPVPGGAAPVPVKVTGKNFATGMTAEWKDPSGVLTQARPVKRNSDTEVEVTVTPGTTKGKGTLTLISAIGLRASKELSITRRD